MACSNSETANFWARRYKMGGAPFWSVGGYDMPALAPVENFTPPTDLLDFEKAVKSKTYERGVHFYLDDYRFDDKIWRRYERYAERLTRFACVLTPDFSLYLDMPYPPKINNVWRSRQIGALLQAAGATVVPRCNGRSALFTSVSRVGVSGNFGFSGLQKFENCGMMKVDFGGRDSRF